MTSGATHPRIVVTETRPLRRSRARLGTLLAEEIRRYISARNLGPGDPLPSEAAFADYFDVSPRVVRDALRELSYDSVITTQQGRTALVREIGPDAMQRYFQFVMADNAEAIGELRELRTTVEVVAAGLSAARMSGSHLRRLEPSSADYHAAIVRACGNRLLAAVSDAVAAVSDPGDCRRLRRTHHRRTDIDVDHTKILEALHNRDSDHAMDLMRGHLLRCCELAEP